MAGRAGDLLGLLYTKAFAVCKSKLHEKEMGGHSGDTRYLSVFPNERSQELEWA